MISRRSLFSHPTLIDQENKRETPEAEFYPSPSATRSLEADTHYFLSDDAAAAAGAGEAAATGAAGALSDEDFAEEPESDDEELLSPEDFGLAFP
jgi:hypothetical protein